MGDRQWKKGGTDPNYLRARDEAIAAEKADKAAKAQADAANRRPNAEPVSKQPTSVLSTSPVTKAETVEQKLAREAIESGKEVIRPVPAPKPDKAFLRSKAPATAATTPDVAKQIASWKQRLDLQKKQLESDKMRESSAHRDRTVAETQSRINSIQDQIDRLEGKQVPKSIISEEESASIVKVPAAERSPLQELDLTRKALQEEIRYGEGDSTYTDRARLREEIIKLEEHVKTLPPEQVKAYEDAKAARAKEAAAKSSAVGPEGVLAKQRSDMAISDMEAAITSEVGSDAAESARIRKILADKGLGLGPKTTPKTSRAKKVKEPAPEPEPEPDDEMFTPEQTFEPTIKTSRTGVSLSSVKKVEPKATPKTGRVKRTTQPPAKVKAATKKQDEAKLAKRMEDLPDDTEVTGEAAAAVEEYVKKKHDKTGHPLEITVKPKTKSGKASGRGKRIY
jgi:hypothetical protein